MGIFQSATQRPTIYRAGAAVVSTITSFIMRDNSGSSEALTRAKRAQRRIKGKTI